MATIMLMHWREATICFLRCRRSVPSQTGSSARLVSEVTPLFLSFTLSVAESGERYRLGMRKRSSQVPGQFRPRGSGRNSASRLKPKVENSEIEGPATQE